MSKKGWNNVLIFSMLIMIFMFNGLHRKLGGNAPINTQVLLLPENGLVLTLKFGDIVIERIGQGWRSDPSIALNSDQLAALMTHWQAQQVELQQDDAEAKVMTRGIMPSYYVIAQLAGKQDGAVYAFYPQLEEVWIHDQQQNRWLKAPIAVIATLFPEPLQVSQS